MLRSVAPAQLLQVLHNADKESNVLHDFCTGRVKVVDGIMREEHGCILAYEPVLQLEGEPDTCRARSLLLPPDHFANSDSESSTPLHERKVQCLHRGCSSTTPVAKIGSISAKRLGTIQQHARPRTWGAINSTVNERSISGQPDRPAIISGTQTARLHRSL